ncbi:MAG: hypothetical protein AB7H88_12665 [Vicinamibacterales bacterium]
MRGPGARAGWSLAIALLVMAGGVGLHPDDPAGTVTRPAFTLFVVDQAGARQAVAYFSRGLWASPCGGVPTAPLPHDTGRRPLPVRAIEGSPGAPLYPVRLLTDDPPRFYRARDAVQAITGGRADVPGRVRDTLVYAPAGRKSMAVFVDLVLRTPEWTGVQASGWVQPEADGRVAVVDPRVNAFSSYDDYLAVPRLHPLGVVDVGVPGGRTWVMQARTDGAEEVQLYDVRPDGAAGGPRVTRGGC